MCTFSNRCRLCIYHIHKHTLLSLVSLIHVTTLSTHTLHSLRLFPLTKLFIRTPPLRAPTRFEKTSFSRPFNDTDTTDIRYRRRERHTNIPVSMTMRFVDCRGGVVGQRVQRGCTNSGRWGCRCCGGCGGVVATVVSMLPLILSVIVYAILNGVDCMAI